jgi:hypothetical protein
MSRRSRYTHSAPFKAKVALVMFGMKFEDQAREDILIQGYYLVTMTRMLRAA